MGAAEDDGGVSTSASPGVGRGWRTGLFPLLLVFFWLTLSSALQKTATVDEPAHIARGYAYLRTGDLRLQGEHPPLVEALTAVFWLLEPSLRAPAEVPGWEQADLARFSGSLLWESGVPAEKLLFTARLPIILLALVLGAVVFRWAQEWSGGAAGILALLLFTLDPNLLAHGRLATNDLGVTAAVAAAAYLTARYAFSEAPGRAGRLAIAGIALGVAMATKLTASIFAAALVGLAALQRAVDCPGNWWRDRLAAGAAAAAGLSSFAFLGLWASYGFRWEPALGLAFALPAGRHWDSVARVLAHNQQGHWAFLLGQVSNRGWWHYFPVAWAVKTPLPLLILLVAATALGIARRRDRREAVWALVPPLLFFGVSLTSSLNIGYRHLLPVLPFVLVYVARLARPVSLAAFRAQPVRLALLGGLVAWVAAGSLSVYPDYLTYFNELAGGPDGGHRVLGDSNLDWGQDMNRLALYLDEQGIDEFYLSYFGSARPAYYGLEFLPLPGPAPYDPDLTVARFDPAPGYYAISVSNLQGMALQNPDTYDWFRRREPQARIGRTIYVFAVEPRSDQPSWVAQCYAPRVPLETPEEIAAGFGDRDLRMLAFDCTSAWVYPAGGAPGWYVLDASIDPFDYLGPSEPVFLERGRAGEPSFAVYTWRTGATAEVEQPAASVTEVGGLVRFQGHRLDEAGKFWAWWEVAGWTDAPISSFAHLYSTDGAFLGAGDALGYPAIQWQPGDRFIQAYRLPALAGGAEVQLGVYDLETGERYPVQIDGKPAGDAIRIPLVAD